MPTPCHQQEVIDRLVGMCTQLREEIAKLRREAGLQVSPQPQRQECADAGAGECDGKCGEHQVNDAARAYRGPPNRAA